MTQDSAPRPTKEGAGEWLELVEEALQGLHHALNNRIGSLSALVELHQLGELPPDGSAFDNLAADLKRLEECNRMVRLLPSDGALGEEPLILDDVLADVFAVHRFLHDVRDLQVTIVPNRFVEPVRAARWALVRVLILLLNDVKQLAHGIGTGVRAVTESDEQWVRVEFRVATPSAAETPGGRTNYSERLAGTFGGTVTRRPGAAELRLPTLKARRAADRRSP